MLSDDRLPCVDGNCIGTIESGSCRVCGLAGEGEVTPEREDAPVLPEVAPDQSPAPEVGSSPDDWDERQLCSDGNCTGTVEGGACRVCGVAA